MKKIVLTLITIVCACLTPIVALSDVGDVFNCSKNGAAAASAGSTVPLGGPYVPTADYAVELNTGLLVYKECVLREVVTAKRKAAASQIDQQMIIQFNGYPSRELGHEEVQLADKTMLRYLQNDSLSNFPAAIRTQVQQSIARGYSAQRDPRTSFKCDYSGDLDQVYSGAPTGNYWDAYSAVVDNPACSPFSASVLGYAALQSQTQYELYKNKERLDQGQGVYPVVHMDENGFIVTDTPGQMVLQNGIMAEQSGYKQLEQADDIGEMVDGLYAGVSNQVLSPSSNIGTGAGPGTGGTSGGLAGIAQYMSQVVQSALSNYTQTTANDVIAILQQALQTEQNFNSVVSSTANLLTQTISQLRGKEATCYQLIRNAVCQSGTDNGVTCTGTGGGTLTIATSTAFSQKPIDANIRSLATTITSNVNGSNQKITALQALIASLSANPTQAAQQAALTALAGINPHTGGDVSTATQNKQTITQTMATLVSTTNDAWTQTGAWCDVGTQSVKDAWTACWGGDSSQCPTP